jgi:hypothetical protein
VARLSDYALIADAVYARWDEGNESQSILYNAGWKCPPEMKVDEKSIWALGNPFSSGFQGRVFLDPSGREAMIAYKGTKPYMTSDLTADAKLAMGFVPTQAKDALKHTVDWSNRLKGRKISLVGHSLGGALAQVVGSRAKMRFVTFNAPGMLKQTHGLSSSQTIEISKAKERDEGLGVNYRTAGAFAPIAALGVHIGKVVVLELTSAGHGIGNFVEYFKRHKDGKKEPFA